MGKWANGQMGEWKRETCGVTHTYTIKDPGPSPSSHVFLLPVRPFHPSNLPTEMRIMDAISPYKPLIGTSGKKIKLFGVFMDRVVRFWCVCSWRGAQIQRVRIMKRT